ncbi:MAG: hypothetical protein ACEQSH_00345 [Bacteroidia bacterium]
MSTTTEAAAGIGHNDPPLDLSAALDLDVLTRQLAADTADLMARVTERLDGFERFKVLAANGIPDDTTLAKAGDFARQLSDSISVADDRRTKIKKPVLDAQRAIDGFFKSRMTDPLDAAKRAVLAAVTAYQQKKAREAAEAAAAERRRLAEEAAALAAKAERTGDDDAMEQAIQREEQAAAIPVAPQPAPVVRTDMGSTIGSRKGPWKVRVTDMSKIPATYLLPNEALLLALVKSTPAIQEKPDSVPGVEFYRETVASIR